MAFCRHTGTPRSWPDSWPPPSKRATCLHDTSSSARPPTSCSTAGILTPLHLFPSRQRKGKANYQHITSTGTQSPCQKKKTTPELGAALGAGVCPSQHQCGSPSMLQAAHGQFQQIYILCKPLQGISVDTWGFIYIIFAVIFRLKPAVLVHLNEVCGGL